MSKTYLEVVWMRRSFVCAGLLLLAAGRAVAQDFPRVETAPAFMYIRTQPPFGGSRTGNCAGGGGTFAVNLTSGVGLAADLGGCKVFGLDNTFGVGSKVTGNEFTFLFGPRFTYRNSTPIRPFFEVNFGGVRATVSCNTGNASNACGTIPAIPAQPIANPRYDPNATSVSRTAFALTVGGGFDIKVSRKVAFRFVQAEYLYTRFGNDCRFAYCSNNNNQNSFRLKSGLVIAWGGERPAPPPPAPPPPTKTCWNGSTVLASAECPKQTIALGLSVPQTELCPGASVTISPSASMPAGASYQWTIEGQPIGQGPSLDFGTNGRDPGTYKVGLIVRAEGYEDANAGTAVTVQPYRAPSGSVRVSPAELWFGDKATVSVDTAQGQCGGALRPAALSASEGSIAGNVFDSSSVQFDPSGAAEQHKTVKIVATVADQRSSVAAETSVVVKKKAMAKRLPDIIFPDGKSRVNNCGKRVLLEELKPSLDADPTGKVLLIGHIHEGEKGADGLDQKRALNAAAVISAGQGVCLRFAAAQILVGKAGTAESGGDYQSYFCGTSTVPKMNELAGNQVNLSDANAKYRRVEVWFVPTGGEVPAILKGYQDAASLAVASLGCPR